MDKNKLYELYKACRLCGAGAGYKMPIIQNIVDVGEEIEIKEKIKECLQLEVSANDRMPPLICEVCYDKVNDFYEFFQTCKQTNIQTRKKLGLPIKLKTIEKATGPCKLETPFVVKNEIKVEAASKKLKFVNKNRSYDVTHKLDKVKTKGERKELTSESESKPLRSRDRGPSPKRATRQNTCSGDLPQLVLKESYKKLASSTPGPRSKKENCSKPDVDNRLNFKRRTASDSKEPPAKKTKPIQEEKPGPKSRKAKNDLQATITTEKSSITTVKSAITTAKSAITTSKSSVTTEKSSVATAKLNKSKTTDMKCGIICRICGKEFKSKSGLSSHLTTHVPTYTSTKQCCNCCYEWFDSLELAILHHSAHIIYKCVRCKKRFKKHAQFNDHLGGACTWPPARPPVQCVRCWRSFVTRTLYNNHKCQGEDGRPGGKCQKCKRTYILMKNLLKHETTCLMATNFKRQSVPKIDPEIQKILLPMRVRISKCDQLLHKENGYYDVSYVNERFGLDPDSFYPYLSQSEIIFKNDPSAYQVMTIHDDLKQEFEERKFVNWDSDSDTEITERVKSLTELSLRVIFSNKMIGKVPKREVKRDFSPMNIRSKIDCIVNSLNDDCGYDSDSILDKNNDYSVSFTFFNDKNNDRTYSNDITHNVISNNDNSYKSTIDFDNDDTVDSLKENNDTFGVIVKTETINDELMDNDDTLDSLTGELNEKSNDIVLGNDSENCMNNAIINKTVQSNDFNLTYSESSNNEENRVNEMKSDSVRKETDIGNNEADNPINNDESHSNDIDNDKKSESNDSVTNSPEKQCNDNFELSNYEKCTDFDRIENMVSENSDLVENHEKYNIDSSISNVINNDSEVSTENTNIINNQATETENSNDFVSRDNVTNNENDSNDLEVNASQRNDNDSLLVNDLFTDNHSVSESSQNSEICPENESANISKNESVNLEIAKNESEDINITKNSNSYDDINNDRTYISEPIIDDSKNNMLDNSIASNSEVSQISLHDNDTDTNENSTYYNNDTSLTNDHLLVNESNSNSINESLRSSNDKSESLISNDLLANDNHIESVNEDNESLNRHILLNETGSNSTNDLLSSSNDKNESSTSNDLLVNDNNSESVNEDNESLSRDIPFNETGSLNEDVDSIDVNLKINTVNIVNDNLSFNDKVKNDNFVDNSPNNCTDSLNKIDDIISNIENEIESNRLTENCNDLTERRYAFTESNDIAFTKSNDTLMESNPTVTEINDNLIVTYDTLTDSNDGLTASNDTYVESKKHITESSTALTEINDIHENNDISAHDNSFNSDYSKEIIKESIQNCSSPLNIHTHLISNEVPKDNESIEKDSLESKKDSLDCKKDPLNSKKESSNSKKESLTQENDSLICKTNPLTCKKDENNGSQDKFKVNDLSEEDKKLMADIDEQIGSDDLQTNGEPVRNNDFDSLDLDNISDDDFEFE